MKTAPLQKKYFIDTYTQIAISAIPALTDIILKHSDNPPNDDTQPALLSSERIDRLLNGPYHAFLQTKLTAYSTILRLKVLYNVNHNDNFKTARNDNPLKNNIPEKFLKKLDASQIKKINKALDQLTQTHYKKLQDHYAQWCQTVMANLKDLNIELTILEIAEFSEQVPVDDLFNRFTELKIELPKIHKDKVTFTDFLKLKAQLIIVNSLSRQHQAHGPDELKPYFKKLKPTFDNISKLEVELTKAFKTETQQLIQPISFAL